MKPEDIPVLLVIFNRPDKVRRLLSALKEVKPRYIYIAGDGPREHTPNDAEKCTEARAIAVNISWPCEIRTHFQDQNLGVDRGMEEAFTWFFQNVEAGLIFEDDCIPSVDFFRFAAELLPKYQHDERIMCISGTNFQNNIKRGNASYYFSQYPTWGYAMWRRTWEKFDTKLDGLNEFLAQKRIDTIFTDRRQRRYWIGFFKKIRKGKFTFVDAKLTFSIWNAGGICIAPQVNLIQNIGFDENATHTKRRPSTWQSHDAYSLRFPLTHPSFLETCKEADLYFFKRHRYVPLWKLIVLKLQSYISRS